MSVCKVEIIHSLPGRLRVKIRGLRNNQKLAKSIERTFTINLQIGEIKANSDTGKALIIFDPNRISERELYRELTRSIKYIWHNWNC